MATVHAGAALDAREAADVVPDALRAAVLTRPAARREVLARWIALAGPVSVDDVRARYDVGATWLQQRLAEWERGGALVRGTFGGDRTTIRWTSRRVLEQARRRELAQARQQIAAVPLPAFADFVQRWQHVAPDTRLTGADGTAAILEQLHGVARPAVSWERDYLPARLAPYEPATLGALAAAGRLAWAIEPPAPRAAAGGGPTNAAPALGRLRFFARGTGRLWLAPPPDDGALAATLSDGARAVRDVLRAQGASFTTDLAIGSGLGSQRVRDALRELVAAGLVTNDTVEALRDVLRWKTVFPTRRPDDPDPTRWLPAGFTPSPGRHVVQRRVNPRSLARWQRPDGGASVGWGGRWSLVHTPGLLGVAETDGPSDAEEVARQWLARYGVVSRDWWRREHPAMSWRAIYGELKRLEYRGEVRRGYFVTGLAGAQFALPEAVESLRAPTAESAPRTEPDAPVVLTTSDPANVYTLPLAAGTEGDPLARPRGAGALLVTVAGRIVLAVESRGARVRVADGVEESTVHAALAALATQLAARAAPSSGGRRHDVIVETIDGVPAAGSPHAGALRAAGFRSMGGAMRYYAAVR